MRLDYASVVPAARTAMLGLEKVVHDSDLDPRLVELVKIRASQINGCARCLEMHTKDARALGEEQDRLDLVATWPEAGCVYDDVANHFEPTEVAVLTLAITTINAWNRLNVGLRSRPAATSPVDSEDRRSVNLAIR